MVQGALDSDLLDLIRQLLRFTDGVLVKAVKGMGISLLRTKGVVEQIVMRIEQANMEIVEEKASEQIEECKAIGAKLLQGQIGIGMFGDVRDLLGLTDGVTVAAVRSMLFELFRTRGIKEALLAPLLAFDDELASEYIAGAQVIGGKLMKGEIDDELLDQVSAPSRSIRRS